MNKDEGKSSVLKDKDEFKHATGSAKPAKSDATAGEELKHMGEKTKTSPGAKKEQ